VRSRAVAFLDERPRGSRSGADKNVDVTAAKMAVIGDDENAVVRGAVGQPRAFELRDVNRGPRLHEAGIGGDRAIRNERTAVATQAVFRAGDPEPALAVDFLLEHHRAPVA
jgi:hypothetical protein